MEEKLLKLQRLNLTERQLFDLELLVVGGFAPLTGFLNEDDYNSVVEKMHLVNGTLWSIPIVLDVIDGEKYQMGEEIILCDTQNNPVAFFKIESKYVPDKNREAKLVYGSVDEDHPGVNYLLNKTNNTYLGGKIEIIKLPVRHDFKEWRQTPAELRKYFKDKKIDKVIAFQTRNPIHRAHFELMKNAQNEYYAHILIHPIVGTTKDGDIDYRVRVKSYIELHDKYMKDFATLSLLPFAMRMAGPREAILHALIRKNYGATHFIVGRDHAGPGKDKNGKPYYGVYEARDLVKEYEKEIGITVIPQEEMVYSTAKKYYMPISQVGNNYKQISGTEFRKMLRENKEIPEWFSFPEVIEELRKEMSEQKSGGVTIFFTGLPASGKSTIASMLYSKLMEITSKKIVFLDSDVMRQTLSKGLGFSREDRNENVRRLGKVAVEITKEGSVVICSAIAPYKESREANRKLINQFGTYIEIYMATPLPVCMSRDQKKLYKKAELGILKNVTGVDDPYEIPINPDIIVQGGEYTPEEILEQIISIILPKIQR